MMKISVQHFALILLCQLFLVGIIRSSTHSLLVVIVDELVENTTMGESIESLSRLKRSRKSHKLSSCTCGVRQSDYRITGGQLADDHAWPWVVPLIYIGDSEPWQFCAASIINTQYLLTAAHCAVEMKKKIRKYQAYLGTNSISEGSRVKASITRIKTHPSFNDRTLENDIALIKLTRPIAFSESVQSVCLNQDASPYVGCSGVVAGWGSTKKGGGAVDKLREVKVKVLKNVDCAKNYSAAKIKISSKMMCAALPPKDSCQGDSGGPLFAWNPKTKSYSQIGIVSFGLNCGSQTFPGVYTRLAPFIKWIQQNTRDASYCSKAF